MVNNLDFDVMIYGCSDSEYCNYNPDVNFDDGSCEGYPGVLITFIWSMIPWLHVHLIMPVLPHGNQHTLKWKITSIKPT